MPPDDDLLELYRKVCVETGEEIARSKLLAALHELADKYEKTGQRRKLRVVRELEPILLNVLYEKKIS